VSSGNNGAFDKIVSSKAVFCAGVLFLSLYVLGEAFASAEGRTLGYVQRLFLEERYDRAATEAEALINERAGQRDELYYLKGLSELKTGRYAPCRKTFGEIPSKYPGSARLFDSYIGIGDSYLLDGDNESAVRTYNDMLENFKSDKNISIVYYRLAESYKRQGATDKFKSCMDKARSLSPLSFESRSELALQRPIAVPAKTVPVPAVIVEQPVRKSVPAPVEPPRKREVSNFAKRSSEPPAKQDISMKQEEDVSIMNITVQVGSFKNKSNADRMARKLNNAGYDSHIEAQATAKGKLYKVKAGRPRSLEEAGALASRLKKYGYSTRICTGDACQP